MTSNMLCQYLEWDSDFFQRRIARVNLNRLNTHQMNNVLDWCDQHKIECVYFLADSMDQDTINLVEHEQFRFVDIRINLEKVGPVIGYEPYRKYSGIIRRSIPEDIPILREIAGTGFRLTRFHFDGNFPRDTFDSLYQIWVEKSCSEGFADSVLVAEQSEKPVGFITCKKIDDINGNIGLIGVAEDTQGSGVGGALVNAALEWFSEQTIQIVSVVTQGRNIPAQRLYQRSGFLTQSLYVWYHKWF